MCHTCRLPSVRYFCGSNRNIRWSLLCFSLLPSGTFLSHTSVRCWYIFLFPSFRHITFPGFRHITCVCAHTRTHQKVYSTTKQPHNLIKIHAQAQPRPCPSLISSYFSSCFRAYYLLSSDSSNHEKEGQDQDAKMYSPLLAGSTLSNLS